MRTPEPFGEIGQSDPDNLVFVVQRHKSAREHYDLRLEFDGVLKSWAIPEGPSLSPKVRRLAIATEDHPLAYAHFEGDIPDSEYGAGLIVVWDQGSWVPLGDDPTSALKNGELKFRLAGSKLAGGWMLKKLPKGRTEWLLIKERDPSAGEVDILVTSPASVLGSTPKKGRIGQTAPMPKKVRPQLPTKVPSPPEGADWVHEIKYDGHRTLAWINDGETRLITRNGFDWSKKYGCLGPALAELDCKTALIDGEIIVQDARGGASFDLLQRAISEGRDEALVFYAFDLLYLNGRDLMQEPLIKRKEQLRRLIPASEDHRAQFSEHTEGNGKKRRVAKKRANRAWILRQKALHCTVDF